MYVVYWTLQVYILFHFSFESLHFQVPEFYSPITRILIGEGNERIA